MERDFWQKRNGHYGIVIWLTGLSGSGKTTLACEVERQLVSHGLRIVTIDGDQLRQGLNRDLGFTEESRKENLRRAMEVALMFLDKGFVVLVPMISPFESSRREIKNRFERADYAEIYVKCSLEACEQRDPKGLYRKARNGEIPDFTGIDSPYEPPMKPDLLIDTEQLSIEAGTNALVSFIERRVKHH